MNEVDVGVFLFEEKLFSDALRVLAVSNKERKNSALSSFLCFSINNYPLDKANILRVVFH
jgi:hypothetical protein